MFKRPSKWIFAAIAVGTALVVVSGLVALYSALQIGRLFRFAVNENFPALRAAEELEIALLKQRGFVSSYMIDGGNREWLEELERRKDDFPASLGPLKSIIPSPISPEKVSIFRNRLISI